jgi:ComF family protein
MGAMQSLLKAVYPPHCLNCATPVDGEHGLCPACWRETPFVSGLVCDVCGTPLPGDDPGEPVLCDTCLTLARPWSRGRTALVYRDTARRLALGLKHADRTDLAQPAAGWMLRAAAPILTPDLLVTPVPLHWWRLLRRRYNQSALLAEAVARRAGLDYCPDLLQRRRATPMQKGRGVEARFANMAGAIRPHPRRAGRLEGRRILLVDDVMTSGATLAAAAEACLAGGAAEVRVLTLARAAKDD